MSFMEDTGRFVGADGSYAIEVPETLAAEPGALSGGVVTALALRAAQLESTKPEPTSLIGHILRPVPPGTPLTVLVSKPAERPGAESIAVTIATDTPRALFGLWVGDERAVPLQESNPASGLLDPYDAVRRSCTPVGDVIGLDSEPTIHAGPDGERFLHTRGAATPDDDPFVAAAWAVTFAEASSTRAAEQAAAAVEGAPYRAETMSISAHFRSYRRDDGGLAGRVSVPVSGGGHAVVQTHTWTEKGHLVAIIDQQVLVTPRLSYAR